MGLIRIMSLGNEDVKVYIEENSPFFFFSFLQMSHVETSMFGGFTQQGCICGSVHVKSCKL